MRLTQTSVPGSRTTRRSRSPRAERNPSRFARSGTTTSMTGVKPAFARFVARAHRFSWHSRICRAASSAGSPNAQTWPLTTIPLTMYASTSAERLKAAATARETVDLPAPGAPVTTRHARPRSRGDVPSARLVTARPYGGLRNRPTGLSLSGDPGSTAVSSCPGEVPRARRCLLSSRGP